MSVLHNHFIPLVYKGAGDFIIKKKDSQAELLKIRWKTNYEKGEFQNSSLFTDGWKEIERGEHMYLRDDTARKLQKFYIPAVTLNASTCNCSTMGE